MTKIKQSLLQFEHDFLAELHSNNRSSVNLAPSQLALLLGHCRLPEKMKKCAVVEATIEDAYTIKDATQAWANFFHTQETWHVITGTLSEQEQAADVYTKLSNALHHILFSTHTVSHFFVPIKQAGAAIPDPKAYNSLCTSLTTHDQASIQQLTERLLKNGYVRHRASIEPGSIRVRGENIDISHPILPGHYTATFFGNTIESIVHHEGQRSRKVNSVKIPPMKFPKETISLPAFISSHAVFGPSNASSCNGAYTITTDSINPSLAFPWKAGGFSQNETELETICILYKNHDRAQSFAAKQNRANATLCPSQLSLHPIRLSFDNTLVISEEAIFPSKQKHSASPITYERALELIGQLSPGKAAVHADHGIGIYEGLETKQVDSVNKEYLVLRYAEGDALFVPVEFAHKVSPYIGEATPKVHRLGGTLWQKTRKKARHDAAAFAKELLLISKKRAKATRPPHTIDQGAEAALNEHFGYELTPGQKQAWKEIEEDLQNDHPMDRLLIGDVGFGKTELAIRAAYHAVQNNKQVAVLAPTTLLVQQHFDTFKQRLPKLASSIAMLSRFIPVKEQKETKARIAKGEVSIAIGTHALLSASTSWENLGLLIIDEEQRFGVKQKEHLKKMRASVDILSLSATPIPRTLSMALSGLRTLSLIDTAPQGRKEIRTFVKQANTDLLQNAIQRELSRGGQVYAVAPKIRHLGSIKEEIQSLFPQARISIAHGRLPDALLSSIIHEFDAGEIDILVSSSIVENGLDLPNANTMIVWHSTHFGLGELYQLRGRIGRRSTQGYAYFLYGNQKLTPVQRQRLTALTESARLGSGWEIARRDLEIRGSGNILGAQQSGSVNSVGASLYLDMVHSAIDEMEEEQEKRYDSDIQLPLSAILPTHYIQESSERTKWYQRLTRAKTKESLAECKTQLQEQYGPLPPETANLFLLIELQRAAGKAGVQKMHSKTISPSDEDPYARIIMEVQDVPAVLEKVSPLGRWEVREQTLTWDMDAITPELIKKITQALLE